MSDGVERLLRSLDHQYAPALTVGLGALAALVWSALSSRSYDRIISGSWDATHDLSMHSVVINGAMTLFFASVGLELSRESRAPHRPALRESFPSLFGALGGMVGTAVLSLVLGALLHSSALHRGWGVPMATDVAFTLGVLALAGPRIPPALRIFLLTLAIADDVLSVVVLSATGVTHPRVAGLISILFVFIAGIRIGRRLPPWLAFSLLLIGSWCAFAWAGVDPALSGALAGVLVPVSTPASRHVELVVARWSVGAVLPLFALVACGVAWGSLGAGREGPAIIVGTTIIRIVGKVAGICAAVFLVERAGIGRPSSITTPVLVGGCMLCSIGFTVPLLFAGALFGRTSAAYSDFTLGLLLASLLGALGGVATLRRATRIP